MSGPRRLGCVLIHGFTAAPDEMRPLADALATHGFPCRGVRVAGHGTTLDDLANCRREDWIRSVIEPITTFAQEVDRIALVGMSMGALLAISAALQRPASISALVLCAPVFAFADPRVAHLRWLTWLPLALTGAWRLPKGPRGLADPEHAAASTTYDAMPFGAVCELAALQAEVVARLSQIAVPTLVLHGAHDRTVPASVVTLTRERITRAPVESHVLPLSGHVIVLDGERDRVASLVTEFLDRIDQDAGFGAPNTK